MTETMIMIVLAAALLFSFAHDAVCSVRQETFQSSFGQMIGLFDDNITFGNESRSGIRFLGIPYAKPPIGDKRFQKPVPETNINATYNATYFRHACPQSRANNPVLSGVITSENCLYLNLFLPGNTVSTVNNYSVMIYIYGGGFQTGLANLYFADVLSSFNDVIVVTFNYRVNVFGFLDDGTGEFANNGLHDQKLAIDWVHNHIQSFGGNRNSVTLFGGSAGGVGVMYQAFYPENRGKIQRIIAQSGSPFSSWTSQSDPRRMINVFAARMNCTGSNSSETVNCLRGKPADELINNLDMSVDFRPTFDGHFLTSNSLSLFTKLGELSSESVQAFLQLDVLTGFNDKDGALIFIPSWGFRLAGAGISLENGVPRNFFESVYVSSVVNDIIKQDSLLAQSQAMIHEYIDWNDPNNIVKIRGSMVDISSDALFIIPVIRAALAHANNSMGKSTFFYQFSRQNGLYPPSWLNGADHTREREYVFGFSSALLTSGGISQQNQATISRTDINLSRAIMKYWTNFAKTGNPNSADMENIGYPTWPVFTPGNQSYMNLNINLSSDSIQHYPVASRLNYWTQVVPALSNRCVQENCKVCETSSNTMMKASLFLNTLMVLFNLPLLTDQE